MLELWLATRDARRVAPRPDTKLGAELGVLNDGTKLCATAWDFQLLTLALGASQLRG